ncbi:CBS domain containing-hemolysin-like protein [Hymenobacter luteus]|uniref:CBS domain containing-hemolysin-like protein n=2 Tax=Hymenobacter TaxID=89966 RepID=A0A7W9SY30_9BACT|nr:MULTISPECIES: hemolysin family protein [Hymenobacter]MBB4600210.1 CBS domain containing-hemolysin-like protein [Hymenobacter latericoloratus]MBB6057480.1 CBS domain containing-hemolysin-like protein [Hymenobacter luteus]
MGLDILFTILLVVANGFFVAAEFALVKVRVSQLELRAQEGNRWAKLTLGLVHKLDAYLSATQLGITLASLALGWVGEEVMAEIVLDVLPYTGLKPLLENFGVVVNEALAHRIAVPISFALITIMHIVLGELVPKSLAIQRSEAVSLIVAGPLKVFYKILSPIIGLMNMLSNAILRLVGIQPASEHEVHTTEELRLLLDQSKQSGEIQESEHELLENVFEFNDRMVKQIMVPRTKLSAIDVSTPQDEVLEAVYNEGYSRIPVYEGNIDNIVGVLYVKDLLQIIRRQEPIELAKIIRPAYFVPETKKINRLLRQFQRKHMHMAIVSDEFGGVSGIVTIEDIMEELVGEIQDEYDNEVPVVEKVSETEYRVNTATAIPDANEYLPYPLPEGDDYETVGGLLNVLYGNIPEVGDVAVLDNYEFRVLQRSRRSVELVQLRVTTQTETEDTEEALDL